MAAGKRYKWQGSSVEITVDFAANSPGASLTAISKANPAVVTAANTLANGDVVRITGVVGMTEVNGNTYIVTSVSGSSFALAGVDSTGYGTYVSGGTFDEATWSNFCELTGYNRQAGSKSEMDATTICSDFKEFELDLPDLGSIAVDFNYAPDVTLQAALQDFDESSEVIGIRQTLPTPGGARTFLGFVNAFSDQGSNGTLWKASASLRLTGRPVYVAAV